MSDKRNILQVIQLSVINELIGFKEALLSKIQSVEQDV